MKEATPGVIYLKDYQQPAYWIDTVDMEFHLGEEVTRVISELSVHRNTNIENTGSLVLDGEKLRLVSVEIDDQILNDGCYVVDDTSLTLNNLPDEFRLRITTEIQPQLNTSLEGLYKSSGNFCTQCEAEGFRKITYYLDRPDVMAVYTVKIIADKSRYPVLLSNGNNVESGELTDGKHWVKWHDPFKKPCYLFALVAGDLVYIEDYFKTMSGRNIQLRIYVQEHNIDQCQHAMDSLKKSMQWDEETYGREYDLDIYNIVAVDDFNMGAMENKGLNIFNSKYVLARQDTATDVDFINIEGVIGHEYFHNWSGNRVTCRDWFQLTLKEGLTVFRDQQFTADMNAAAPKRIDDVNILRTSQFAEDASPMAHPIQPDSYCEINNFYTVTVYNKGAEVIRMIHTILGEKGFRKGMDLYFDRHDGQAATTEDFIKSMEEANQISLEQFRLWYKQSGTPEIKVSEAFNAQSESYTLTLKQNTPETPGQSEKKPFHIPVSTAIIDAKGDLIQARLADESNAQNEFLLHLTDTEQSFVFEGVKERPVLSILRNYSAPVKLKFERSKEDLAFCMAHDTDEFNRWDAGQHLASLNLFENIDACQSGEELTVFPELIYAIEKVLTDHSVDNALKARALTLPSFSYVAEQLGVIHVDAIFKSREYLLREIAHKFSTQWLELYTSNTDAEYQLSSDAMGRHFLKQTALSYLMYCDEGEGLALEQFNSADNMTDQQAAFKELLHHKSKYADKVTQDFYEQWKHEQLVLDKWFMLQSTVPSIETIHSVKSLLEHPDFDINNPNRVRSVIATFCAANPVGFHLKSGEGYQLLTEYVEKLNTINPQIAARLTIPLTRWKRYEEALALKMKEKLQYLAKLQNISTDVSELVNKSL